ncbi:MAG: hypothetical protein ACYCYP_06280 [Leptospirales bacterium]
MQNDEFKTVSSLEYPIMAPFEGYSEAYPHDLPKTRLIFKPFWVFSNVYNYLPKHLVFSLIFLYPMSPQGYLGDCGKPCGKNKNIQEIGGVPSL